MTMESLGHISARAIFEEVCVGLSLGAPDYDLKAPVS